MHGNRPVALVAGGKGELDQDLNNVEVWDFTKAGTKWEKSK